MVNPSRPVQLQTDGAIHVLWRWACENFCSWDQYTDNVQAAESNLRVEKMLRTTSIELGLTTAVAACPLPGSAIKGLAIPNTVSQAWYLGRAIYMARKAKTSIVKAIVGSFDISYLAKQTDAIFSSMSILADYSSLARLLMYHVA